MAADFPDNGAGAPAQTFTPARLAMVAGAAVVLALAVYWLFLRTTFDPVLSAIPPEDAADVVKVLDAKKIAYRLADGGTTILVPSDEAAKARIELVGSELPMRGQVGFELFNESDMGLTEFAQKINYQRALQGELARTVLMLDGIQSVRVHLGLAERSLFRDEQAAPKASIALVLKPGNALTESRVSGIQRLVAGAIPDLAPEAVAVLDETGKVVSRPEAVAAPPLSASDARVQLHRATILAGLRQNHPTLRVGVTVGLQVPGAARTGGENAPGKGDPLKVTVTTAQALDIPARAAVTRSIRDSLALEAGDVAIAFVVGDPAMLGSTAQLAAPAPAPASDQIVANSVRRPVDPGADYSWPIWLLALPLVAAVLGIAVCSDLRRRRRAGESLHSFTEQLRQRLAAVPEGAV